MSSTTLKSTFMWHPYPNAIQQSRFAASVSSDADSLDLSGITNPSDGSTIWKCHHNTFLDSVPNVIARQRCPPSAFAQVLDFPAFQQRPATVRVLTRHLLANPAESQALLQAMIVNRSLLLRALSMARGQLVIGAVKMAMEAGSIHGHVLLESIMADKPLLWMMIEGQMGGYILTALYDLASNPWRIQLHSMMIPRLAELCKHSNANYLLSHALEFHRVHHDNTLVQGLSALFASCSQFASIALDKHGLFVAIEWARVLSAKASRFISRQWLRDQEGSTYLRQIGACPAAKQVVDPIIDHLLASRHKSAVRELRQALGAPNIAGIQHAKVAIVDGRVSA